MGDLFIEDLLAGETQEIAEGLIDHQKVSAHIDQSDPDRSVDEKRLEAGLALHELVIHPPVLDDLG